MSKYCSLFPFFSKKRNVIYLDSAATGLKFKNVIDREIEFLEEISANDHSNDYENAIISSNSFEILRKSVARFINAKSESEIVFTSGTTASLNQVAFGLKHLIPKGSNIVLNDLEHASNVIPWLELEQQGVFEIRYIKLNKNGSINFNDIKNVVDENTFLISFANINNTYSVENDTKSICREVKRINNKTLVNIDAAQSIMHLITDVQDWEIDFLSFSAHKLYGPFGLGILWGKFDLLKKLKPLIYGGGSNQEFSEHYYKLKSVPYCLEAGTQNLSSIYAFQGVFDVLEKKLKFDEILSYEQKLKNYAIEKAKKIKNKNVIFYNLDNLGPTLIFNVKGVPAEEIGVFFARKYNICLRTGTACAKMIYKSINSSSFVRASFSIYNSKKDIDVLFEALENSDKWVESII